MTNYPENTPQIFIDFYESKYSMTHKFKKISIKEVVEKFIYNESLKKISKPLASRLNKKENPILEVLYLSIRIIESFDGPNAWQALTQKEQQDKSNKIEMLLNSLLTEIEGTPLDKVSFSSLIDPDMNGYMYKTIIQLIRKEGDKSITEDEKLTLKLIMNTSTMSIKSLLIRIKGLELKPEKNPIIKRKVNAKRLFFIRNLCEYFKRSFDTPLYNITAEISSAFLDEHISIDDVRSAMKK